MNHRYQGGTPIVKLRRLHRPHVSPNRVLLRRSQGRESGELIGIGSLLS
jgi:hypothetical protein